MNTKQKGMISEVAIIKKFLEYGWNVSLPYGENQRYDMIVDIDDSLHRVQCKTATLKEGVLVFSCCNATTNEQRPHGNYKGQIEFFAVYSPDLDKCYLVPIDEVGITQANLRIAEAKSKQQKKIRWAKDYEI